MRVQVRGLKIAGSVRVRRSKPCGNSGAKLYDYDAFSRPPKYSYLCLYFVFVGSFGDVPQPKILKKEN